MKVKSKLADIDFQLGEFEVRKNHLVIHSHHDQKMQSRVYVSPDDVIIGIMRALSKPMVWLYFVGFPYFFLRYRYQKKKFTKKRNQWPK